MRSSKLFWHIVIPILTMTLLSAQEITLSEFFQLLQENHPLFRKEALSTEIEGYGRDAYLGSKDWRIASSPTYFHQTPLATSAFAPTSIDQMSGGASLEKTVWKTGGRLAVGWTSDFTDQDIEDIVIPGFITIPAGPPRFYQNNLNVSYTQPLFQNFRGELDRLGYEIGQYSVAAAEVQSLENQEDFLLDMGLRFIDWVLLKEQKTIAEERLRLSEQQLEQTKRKRAANLVIELDVLRSEDAVRIAEQTVVLMDAQLRAKQAELAVLARAQELQSMQPSLNLYQRLDVETVPEATNRLRENSRLLQVLSTRQAQMEKQYQGLKEIAKPQLYLTTQLTAKSGANEFGNSLSFDNSDAGVFLQFNYPLGNRTARADMEKSRLQIRQFELDTDDITLSLEAALNNLLIQIDGIEQVLTLNEQQIESARLKTEEELKRYNQGLGDLTFVIQSQDNERNARLTYAQNAASYQGLNLRLNALLDVLLTADN
jgi:outer membrane protein TolC